MAHQAGFGAWGKKSQPQFVVSGVGWQHEGGIDAALLASDREQFALLQALGVEYYRGRIAAAS
jgi:hypothetical protein